MKFSTKIFIVILIISSFVTCSCGMVFYFVFSKEIQDEFYSKYNSLGETLSNTFYQMNQLSDTTTINAASLLREKIHNNPQIPSDKELDGLAKSLGIHSFYITDKNGKFLRSSDLDISLQKNSIFSYCSGYRNLIYGNTEKELTTIIPSYPDNIPAKFVMIPDEKRNLILEAGYHLEYIEKTLYETIKYDNNILSIGMYAPNGYALGLIDKNIKFSQGFNTGPSIKTTNSTTLKYRIKTDFTHCCECKIKHVENFTPSYYYELVIQVSLDELNTKVNSLKNLIILIVLIAIAFAILLSRLISKKLVNRLNNINKSINHIVKSGDLNIKLDSSEKNDEVTELATSFNQMTESLKKAQIDLIQTEKSKTISNFAVEVAHDIASPIAAMGVAITHLKEKDADQQDITLLEKSMQSIKGITSNLLTHYRNLTETTSEEKPNQDDYGTSPRYIILSNMIEQLVADKLAEWSNSCNISTMIEPEAKSKWLFIASIQLTRTLSNLLNNANESLNKDDKKIKVQLSTVNEKFRLIISDNGCGIPKDKIEEVLSGKSLKHAGKGIGLSTAKEYINSIGGQLSINSEIEIGTSIVIDVPIVMPPHWFPDSISYTGSSLFIILDDDPSILMTWQRILTKLNVECFYFSEVSEFTEWAQTNANSKNVLLFIDYNLSNELNGVDIIQKYSLYKSYLVTSHAEELWLQEIADKSSFKLIPKTFIKDIRFIYNEITK